MAALQRIIESQLQTRGIEAGIAIHHVESGRQLFLHDDRPYPMASVYKLPILVEMYRQVAEGTLSLGQRVALSELDRNTVNYLNEFEPGLRPTLRDLGTLMIILTDSSATDMLLRRLDPATVTSTMRSLGLSSIRIDRTVEDILWDFLGTPNADALKLRPYRERIRTWLADYGKSSPEAARGAEEYYQARRDSARPSDIAKLLGLLARHDILEPRYCDEILEILYRQRLQIGLSRLLPPGTPVGNKTGHLGAVTNDAGIITLPDGSRLIVVVLTRGSASSARHPERALEDQNQLIALIARYAYDTFAHGAPMPIESQQPAKIVESTPARSRENLLQELQALAERAQRRISLDAVNLATGKRLSLRPDERYFMAGLADLPVLMYTLREVERHRLNPSERMSLAESDRQTYGDGFLREFEPGLNPSVDDLLNLLAVRSDASARDILLKRAGADNISRMMKEIGLRDTRIEHTAEDVIWTLLDAPTSSPLRDQPFLKRRDYFQAHFVDRHSPTRAPSHEALMSGRIEGTTAADQARLMSAIALGRFGDPIVSKSVLDRLALRMEALASGGRAVRLRSNAAGASHELALFQENGAQIVVSVLSAPANPLQVERADAINWNTPVNFSPHPGLVDETVSLVLSYLRGPNKAHMTDE